MQFNSKQTRVKTTKITMDLESDMSSLFSHHSLYGGEETLWNALQGFFFFFRDIVYCALSSYQRFPIILQEKKTNKKNPKQNVTLCRNKVQVQRTSVAQKSHAVD